MVTVTIEEVEDASLEHDHDIGYGAARRNEVGVECRGRLGAVERVSGRSTRGWGSPAPAARLSERTPLFGFMEPGYDPPAVMAARVAELVTVGLLGGFLLLRFVSRSSGGRW